MRVIGTAGHVDHGKSALVEALTGVHPDRLKEEQVREMTIDLGFAWMELGGEKVGIVDVPGHRDFIENMLAGVGGIDAALLVIAADEGVMPQTREHLAILDLLRIRGGVIALNKIDLVSDEEWLDLVEKEVRQAVEGTALAEAPVVRVSAVTGAGLPELRAQLEAVLRRQPARPDLGRPRLPIDRAFSLPGFGVVVTGTLTGGRLRVGDEAQVLPGGKKVRIRGLQSHNQKEETVFPGSRTAANLVGISLDELARGQVVVYPGSYRTTQRLDVTYRHLPGAAKPLKHDTQVKFFLATHESIGRVRLLGKEELLPGQEGLIQLELTEPVVAVRGDRFILRRPSPGETLGGGEVLDPQPAGRHKRFNPRILNRLEALRGGSPADLFYQALSDLGIAAGKDVLARAGLDAAVAPAAIQELRESGRLLSLDAVRPDVPSDEIFVIDGYWQALCQQAGEILAEAHRRNPLRRGIPREELKSRLGLNARDYLLVLPKWIDQGLLRDEGALLAAADFKVRFSPREEKLAGNLLARFSGQPYNPPLYKECAAEVGPDLLAALIERGDLVQVSPEVLFRAAEAHQMEDWVIEFLGSNGTLSAAQFRDHFATSRRYALAFLEYLDQRGLTVWDGDLRRLRGAGQSHLNCQM